MTEHDAIIELEWAKNRLMQFSHMDNNRTKSFNMAFNALEEIQQYRAIGTVEKVREYKEIADNIDAVSMAALCISLNKLKEYQAIGTVDECRAAMILKKNATIKFPIMHSAMIPWEVLEPHEQQAIINHGQTLQRLAERGGLSWGEAAAILDDRKIEKKDMDERKSRDFVLKAIDDFYMVRVRKKVLE